MFVLQDVYEFDWPVAVKVPGDGGVTEQSFTVRFRPLPAEEKPLPAGHLAPGAGILGTAQMKEPFMRYLYSALFYLLLPLVVLRMLLRSRRAPALKSCLSTPKLLVT